MSLLAAPADVGTRRGPVDVLVGVDGSAESIGAAAVVAGLLGDRIGRLTLATVIDYDTAIGGEKGLANRTARGELADAANAVARSVHREIDTTVRAGIPADALVARAGDGHYDVIAVGCRGRGTSKVVMGSVATRLARGAPIPVLVVGDGDGDGDSAMAPSGRRSRSASHS